MTMSQERKITRDFGIGDAGAVKLTASIDRSGYCPGECVLLTCKWFNIQTEKKNWSKVNA